MSDCIMLQVDKGEGPSRSPSIDVPAAPTIVTGSVAASAMGHTSNQSSLEVPSLDSASTKESWKPLTGIKRRASDQDVYVESKSEGNSKVQRIGPHKGILKMNNGGPKSSSLARRLSWRDGSNLVAIRYIERREEEDAANRVGQSHMEEGMALRSNKPLEWYPPEGEYKI